MRDKLRLINAATGWDMGEFEMLKVGERALNLARVFNIRLALVPMMMFLPHAVIHRRLMVLYLKPVSIRMP